MPYVESNPKLMIACWATVGVMVAMALVFLRSKRRHYALGVLPLMMPALMYIFSGVIARLINPGLTAASSVQIRIVLDLVAALVACVLIGLIATIVSKNKKTRALFMIACSLFVLIFSSILIINTSLQLTTAA